SYTGHGSLPVCDVRARSYPPLHQGGSPPRNPKKLGWQKKLERRSFKTHSKGFRPTCHPIWREDPSLSGGMRRFSYLPSFFCHPRKKRQESNSESVREGFFPGERGASAPCLPESGQGADAPRSPFGTDTQFDSCRFFGFRGGEPPWCNG